MLNLKCANELSVVSLWMNDESKVVAEVNSE
jgi:hypothetical protein